MRSFCKNSLSFQVQFFQKTFPISYLSHLDSQPCKILSHKCIAAFTLLHGSSLCYRQAILQQIFFLLYSTVPVSFHLLCHLLQTQMLTIFCPVHPSHVPPVLCLSCSALNLNYSLQLLSAAPMSSQKDFGEAGLCYTALSTDQVPWMPMSPSLPVCIPFPTSHQDSYSGHLLLNVGCVLVFYPLLSTAMGSSLAASSFHLPFFLLSVSLPHSVSGSLPSSPTFPLKTWSTPSLFSYSALALV